MNKVYIIWLLMGILVAVSILLVKIKTSPQPVAFIEPGYTIPEGFTAYSNRDFGISSLAYPKDWKTQRGIDEYEIAFTSPNREAAISIEQLYLKQGEKPNYQTYVERLITEDPNIKFEKSEEQIKTINGREWLLFGGTLTINNITRRVHYGIYITPHPSGQQFYRFLLDSNSLRFASDQALFNTLLESVRFYQ